LEEARAWCAARPLPPEFLVQKPLLPDLAEALCARHPLRSAELSGAYSDPPSMDDVTLLVTRRRALLNGSRWDAGRLLRYSPDESQECGGALIYSAGFFTWNNVPPWDTWVALEGVTLLSWVPEAYVPVVELGIDANPERCLTWAD
jgi:hypothetical protein